MAVLVDSSIWIAAAKVENKECLQLKAKIRDRDPLYILDLIQIEVCQGARHEKQFVDLWQYMDAFPKVSLDTMIYFKSAKNFFALR